MDIRLKRAQNFWMGMVKLPYYTRVKKKLFLLRNPIFRLKEYFLQTALLNSHLKNPWSGLPGIFFTPMRTLTIISMYELVCWVLLWLRTFQFIRRYLKRSIKGCFQYNISYASMKTKNPATKQLLPAAVILLLQIIIIWRFLNIKQVWLHGQVLFMAQGLR